MAGKEGNTLWEGREETLCNREGRKHSTVGKGLSTLRGWDESLYGAGMNHSAAGKEHFMAWRKHSTGQGGSTLWGSKNDVVCWARGRKKLQ